jgi:endonuclease/exonuclease/phosphatase family metal-dependent hydrolase
MTRPVNAKDYSQPERLRVVSYNVHSCIGVDGRFAPPRIAGILAALEADVIALQEVEESEYQGQSVSGFLADALQMHRAGRNTHKRGGIDYGNILLSRVAPERSVIHDMEFPRREPRGAIEAELRFENKALSIIATHFGLARKERHAQLRTILELLACRNTDLTVLCADFNEWVPWSRTHRMLSKVLGATPALRTFPSRLPGLSLDRIYASPAHALVGIRTVRTTNARLASDHLPIVADFELI